MIRNYYNADGNLIQYDFDVENPQELSEVIHKLSVEIADIQEKLSFLERRYEEYRLNNITERLDDLEKRMSKREHEAVEDLADRAVILQRLAIMLGIDVDADIEEPMAN